MFLIFTYRGLNDTGPEGFYIIISCCLNGASVLKWRNFTHFFKPTKPRENDGIVSERVRIIPSRIFHVCVNYDVSLFLSLSLPSSPQRIKSVISVIPCSILYVFLLLNFLHNV